jgi:hypothetical protein
MIVLKKYIYNLIAFLFFFCCSCNTKIETGEKETEAITPVTITNISHEQLAETIELNAMSTFRVKDNVKANLNGYIQEVHSKIGDYVEKGKLLFILKTKEASALSNKIGDTTLNFQGLIKIYSPLSGVITSMEKQNGDYIQDGDELAIIAEQGSLVFILEVPFESKKYVKLGNTCTIKLPGNDEVNAIVNSEMPTVNAESQTQDFILKPISSSVLPENLIAKVEIIKSVKPSAQTLPKEAILTNETQTDWWVMKLINDSMAIKIPIKKGIESSGKVEIIEPDFKASDRIIITGNYGLADTAKVSITKQKD